MYKNSAGGAVAPEETPIATVSAAKRDAENAGLSEEEVNKKVKANDDRTAEVAVAPETNAISAEGPAPSPPRAAEATTTNGADKNPTENGHDREEEDEDEDSDEDDLAALDQENVITTGRRTRGGPKPDYVALAKDLPDDDSDDEDAVPPETGDEDADVVEDGDVEDDE